MHLTVSALHADQDREERSPSEGLDVFFRGAVFPAVQMAGAVGVAFLAQFTPMTAALYAGTSMALTMMSKEHRRAFADGFSGSNPVGDDPRIGSPEFARAARISAEAASRTTDEQKIQMVGRLLRRGLDQNLIDSFDDFKEYVQIVDDLHPRELAILFILKEQYVRLEPRAALFGMPVPDDLKQELKDQEGDVSADQVRWKRAKKEAIRRLQISEKTLAAMVNRITRTGLILRTPTYGGEDIVSASPLFHHLFEALT